MSDNLIGRRLIGIDPGSESSGMVVLDDSEVIGAFNLVNDTQLYDKLTNYIIHRNVTVVVEDLAPYTLRLTPQVISTAKFIGELSYRLKIEAGVNVVFVPRSEVKLWCFNTFPVACAPLIDKKIEKKGLFACDIATREEIRVYPDGKIWKKRKGSFVYVDDKVVTECMKELYQIPVPKAGSGYQYGLKDHAWQALAVLSCYKFRTV